MVFNRSVSQSISLLKHCSGKHKNCGTWSGRNMKSSAIVSSEEASVEGMPLFAGVTVWIQSFALKRGYFFIFGSDLLSGEGQNESEWDCNG